MNNVAIAAALRLLADAFEAPAETPPAQPVAAPAPQPRGRGRPAKPPETAAPAASPAAAAPPADEAADPFSTPAAPEVPAATLDEVRAALKALKADAGQDIALTLLKNVGEASNLTELPPSKYGAVVAAVKRVMVPAPAAPAVAPVEDDPFEVVAAPAAKPVTIEEVKAAIVAAKKKVSDDRLMKIVMDHGGHAANPQGGPNLPSLKALPPEQYAVVIAELANLPATK